jgi:hypothetical protein
MSEAERRVAKAFVIAHKVACLRISPVDDVRISKSCIFIILAIKDLTDFITLFYFLIVTDLPKVVCVVFFEVALLVQKLKLQDVIKYIRLLVGNCKVYAKTNFLNLQVFKFLTAKTDIQHMECEHDKLLVSIYNNTVRYDYYGTLTNYEYYYNMNYQP